MGWKKNWLDGNKDYYRNYDLNHAEQRRENKRRWEREHAEYVREQKRQRYQKRAEEVEQRTRRWQENNPHRVAKAAFVRRQKILIGGSFTKEEWDALCAHHGGRCLACGKAGTLRVDHVIPVSKGGHNTIDNIQPLCLPCNKRKGSRATDYRGN